MSAPADDQRGARARPTSPYKGLAPFEDSELDELLFFGREHERDVIVGEPRRGAADGPLRAERRGQELGAARRRRARPAGAAGRAAVVVYDAWRTTRARRSPAPSPPRPASSPARSPTRSSSPPRAARRDLPAARPARGVLRLPRRRPRARRRARRARRPAPELARPRPDRHPRGRARAPRLVQAPAPGPAREPAPARPPLGRGGAPRDPRPGRALRRARPEEEGLAIEPELVDAVLAGVRTGGLVAAGRGPRRRQGAAAARRRGALPPGRHAAALGSRARGGVATSCG